MRKEHEMKRDEKKPKSRTWSMFYGWEAAMLHGGTEILRAYKKYKRAITNWHKAEILARLEKR